MKNSYQKPLQQRLLKLHLDSKQINCPHPATQHLSGHKALRLQQEATNFSSLTHIHNREELRLQGKVNHHRGLQATIPSLLSPQFEYKRNSG